MTTPFVGFPKISRLRRNCVITEKLDGTNSQIHISPMIKGAVDDDTVLAISGSSSTIPMSIRAGSRNRWLKIDDDNYGFAGWVKSHAGELVDLGEGQHFGEWWGLWYSAQLRSERHRQAFLAFNAGRWGEDRPDCCDVVPVLYNGAFATDTVDDVLRVLKANGSQAVPGFMKPEGIVVFMTASNHLYKVLAENDDVAKGQLAA